MEACEHGMGDAPQIIFWVLGDGAEAKDVGTDSSLWSQLPGEVLLKHVLPRLPAISQLRLRAVCKEWRRLLTSLPSRPWGPVLSRSDWRK